MDSKRGPGQPAKGGRQTKVRVLEHQDTEIAQAMTRTGHRNFSTAALEYATTYAKLTNQGVIMIATYTNEGYISVDGTQLGTYDADGGEWIHGVDAVLARHGFKRIGNWDGDNATVIEA